MEAWFFSFRSKIKKPSAMTIKWSVIDFVHVRAPISLHAAIMALNALFVPQLSSH